VNIVAVNDGDASMASVWNSLPNLGFFQSPELGDLYTASTRHKVLRVVTMDGESPTGYAQVIVFREGPTLLGSVGAHGTIRHGPVIRPGAGEWELAALLRKTAKASHGALAYLRVYPGRRSLPPGSFAREGFDRQSWLNFYIDLTLPEGEIFNRLTKERRYGIRKASERGVVVSRVESEEHVAEAYALLLETHKRARFPLEPRGFFERGFRRFYPRQLQIFIARSGNTPVATSVLAVDGDAAVNWYAGSVTPSRMRQLYPNDALIWEAIRWSRAHGLSTFDMGGGGPPGTKEGFVKFKREFGGDEIDVGHYTYVPQRWKFTAAVTGFHIIRKIRWLER